MAYTKTPRFQLLGEPISVQPAHIRGAPRARFLELACSPDGQILAGGAHDGHLHRWDAHTFQPLGAEAVFVSSEGIKALAFSPNSQELVGGTGDGRLHRWEAASGRSLEPHFWIEAVHRAALARGGHTSAITALAWSPDGREIVSAAVSGFPRRWDAASGKLLGELVGHAPSNAVWALAYSPDGHMLASVSSDGTLRRWDARTGAPFGEALGGSRAPIYTLAFSPDGQEIVSGTGLTDGPLQRWNAQTGQPLGSAMAGHAGAVLALAYSPDGTEIVSGSDDQSLRRWDARNGRPLRSSRKAHESKVWSLVYLPSGKEIISSTENGLMRRWQGNGHSLPPPAPVWQPRGFTRGL